MSSEDFSHSDSYKGYVNSVLNSIQDRNISDPIWGPKIPSNYEELRQHCIAFIDKYCTAPSIQPGLVINSLSAYQPDIPEFDEDYIHKFKDDMIREVMISKFRDLEAEFESNADISLEVAQDHADNQNDLYQQEVEPFNAISEAELSGMCLDKLKNKLEHRLLISIIAEKIFYIPFSHIKSTTTNFITVFANNHKQLFSVDPVPFDQRPPLLLSTSDQLDAELSDLSCDFELSKDLPQSELLYQVNKLFISNAEKSVTWNVLCVNDQISDPAASGIQFKLFAARAHVNLNSNPIDFISSHRQLVFVKSQISSFAGKNDEILCGEESFLHVASAQVVHQRITELTRGVAVHSESSQVTSAQKQSGIIKMKYLRTQRLRQTIISIVNWIISTLKRAELDIRDIRRSDCFSNAQILFERDIYVDSKQFPHCLIVRDPNTSHNVLYAETLALMDSIREDLLSFGSYYIRKWEKECGAQIDRKSIVEDLYECEWNYCSAKKLLIESLLALFKKTNDENECRKIYELMKFFALSRPLLALDCYDYFTVPFDMNTQILTLIAQSISSEIITNINDIEQLFTAVKDAVELAVLKQNTLNLDAFVTIEGIFWSYIADFLKDQKENSLSQIIEKLEISVRAQRLLDSTQLPSPNQLQLFGKTQTARFEVARSIIIYNAYLKQCEISGEEKEHHLPRSLFSELTSEDGEDEDHKSDFILAVDEVKNKGIDIKGDHLDIVSRLQALESSLLDSITSFNFTQTEFLVRQKTLKGLLGGSPKLFADPPDCYRDYFNLDDLQKSITFLGEREYPPFQSLIKLKSNIRESVQVLNLNAGSHLDELLAAQQKQTNAVVQFIQNRGRLPDVFKLLGKLTGPGNLIPSVLDGYSMIESVQSSMRREKVRSILEFYSLVLLYGFLSYHANGVGSKIEKLHKRQRKGCMDSPQLRQLLEETSGLSTEAQKSQVTKTHASELLVRIAVACLESGLELGRLEQSHGETAPAILNLSGDWTIQREPLNEFEAVQNSSSSLGSSTSSLANALNNSNNTQLSMNIDMNSKSGYSLIENNKQQNIMKEIETELEALMDQNIKISNLHFLFLYPLSNAQRFKIKAKFDSLVNEKDLMGKYRELKQKTLLIRLISSPTFSAGELCEFPSPFNHYLVVIDNILRENNEGLRFVLLHILIQRCVKHGKLPPKPNDFTPPQFVTEKSPFLADVDSLPQETHSDVLHPALAQFLENLQLQSKSETRSEIKISQFHVNQALLKFSQSLTQLFDSSLVESHKAFLALHTMLYDANHRHEEEFRKRVQAINREARTFNRKLQTALADRSHTVGYEINLLEETLKSSRFDKTERQKQIRRKLREEYLPQVRELTLQLFSLKHNLEQYQKNLQHEIEGNMFEIKKQSISQLLRSQNLPEEVKDSMKQAFDFDDVLHDLMEKKSELSSTVFKLKAMVKLQDFAVRSEFQVKLKKIEEQREMVKQENAEFTGEREVKEAALKQQYSTVMQSVAAAEKEVDKLRRELELENKNRKKLREWRSKHEKRVAVLEKKLNRLREWSKYKPDKLIFELDRMEKEIERRKRTKEREPQLLEKTKAAVEKELERCQNQLKTHQALKEELSKQTHATVAKQGFAFSNEMQDEDLVAVMEENERLKAENDQLQQRLAELSLQITAVSQVTIGKSGLKVKASRLDGLC